MDRLLTASGPWGAGTVSYDNAGNITRQQFGTYSINYAYGINRVASISGSVNRTYSYDGAGNVTNNGSASFAFDALSQMTCANCGASNEVTYQYDGQGRRVTQDANGQRTYFVQAPNGDLLFEYQPYRLRWTKHAYLHGKRVASESGSDATPSTTTVSTSVANPVYGQSVTLTAAVGPAGTTGTVTFLDGDQSLGTATLVSGSAAITVPTLAVGSHSIVASYSGDGNYQTSTGTLTLNVAKRASSVTMSGVPATATLGQTVTLSASVSGIAPSGQVQFRDGPTVIATAFLSNGSAAATTPSLVAGRHDLSVA
jgi:hypothetical protein